MQHHARVTGLIPHIHRHLDRTTISHTYLPHIRRSFGFQQLSPQVRWLAGGTVALAVAYEAELQANEGDHLTWINAALAAAQHAGLQVTEAYVTRSVSMALVGGGAGAAGGYRAGGAAGAIVIGAVGLIVGHVFRTHVPIYRVDYSQYYGWQLVPVTQFDPRTLQFGLA